MAFTLDNDKYQKCLKPAQKQSMKDMEYYLKEIPKEERLEWLKDGEEWIREYHKQKNKKQ